MTTLQPTSDDLDKDQENRRLSQRLQHDQTQLQEAAPKLHGIPSSSVTVKGILRQEKKSSTARTGKNMDSASSMSDDDDDDDQSSQVSSRSSFANVSGADSTCPSSTSHRRGLFGMGASSVRGEGNGGSNMLFTSTAHALQFLKAETVGVIYSRRLVYFVIFIAAITLGTLTYTSFKEEQKYDFLGQYTALCTQFTTQLQTEVKNVFVSYDLMSRELTSAALNENSTWPFVVIPYFERYMESMRPLTKNYGIALTVFVQQEQREEWESFVVNNHDWINESIEASGGENYSFTFSTTGDEPVYPGSLPDYYLPSIQRHSDYLSGPLVNQTDSVDMNFDSLDYAYAPAWQHSPFRRGFINFDFWSFPIFQRSCKAWWERQESVFSETIFPLLEFSNNGAEYTNVNEPFTQITLPIFSKLPKTEYSKQNRSDVVAMITSIMSWTEFLSGILRSDSLHGLIMVLLDPSDRKFSFRVDGSRITYLGEGDLHDTVYDQLYFRDRLINRVSDSASNTQSYSRYDYEFILYPSREMETEFYTNEPISYALSVVGIFVFTAFIFAVYNYFIQHRQNKVLAALTATSKVIVSLFPANVLDRLMKEAEVEAQNEALLTGKNIALSRITQKAKLRTFLDDAHEHIGGVGDNKEDANSHIIYKTKPIADLYSCATVMYADIVGFTAWSSVREPSQVFTLLETLFRQFDMIAKRRRVFKVETIGDCYIAVCGVPDPRSDHAVVMARFARDCVLGLCDLGEKLEIELGPDTSELGIRVGLHSGPVTAGILRGEKARFQLFGDTVNMCAYMERTSAKNRIQMSQQTADLLLADGKASWLEKRHDAVNDDGYHTYWLVLKDSAKGSKSSSSDHGSHNEGDITNNSKNSALEDSSNNDDEMVSKNSKKTSDQASLKGISSATVATSSSDSLPSKQRTGHDAKIKRLVEWNAEMLIRLLKQVVAHRKASEFKALKSGKDNMLRRGSTDFISNFSLSNNDISTPYQTSHLVSDVHARGQTVIHEVVEIIDMPEFNSRIKLDQVDPATIELDPAVCSEMRSFVYAIAAMYRDNPFHNFEHASHVTMSVSKLLSRIVAPDLGGFEPSEDARQGPNSNNASDDGYDYDDGHKFASTLHDHTYGITSDPMTQFACVFSALIHDVDHPGVPNAQLVKESDVLARLYNNQSVAEQNSIDIAWRMFMDDDYAKFRAALCPTHWDIIHFRQLVVNSVMATDIVDKKLKELRNNRWDVAFQATISNESLRDQINRKATIVIEHLIQASDVSHTMQHWHVYCKWNEMFFHEMYKAFKDGRSDRDPAEFWYKGEIGFFDFYIIPLAKKLKDCGVFGVSSDEYLNYAMKNRAEWEDRGEEVVAKMVEKYRSMFKEEE